MNERRWTFSIATRRQAFVAAYRVSEQLMRYAGEWELVLRKKNAKRTKEQNNRYWAMLFEVSAVVWLDGKRYSDECWHEYFKRTFIGCEELPGGGLVGISTTTLTVEQFANYMTQIEHWCAENGYPVMQEAA